MFENIFHPTDFTATSQTAFCHALRIALAANAQLKMLHVNLEGEHSRHRDFPSVRDVLQRWKMIPEGSSRRAVGRLGVDVDKMIIRDSEPVQAVTDFLLENPSSLTVLAAHRRARTSWFGHSKAEPIAREAGETTLFVPERVKGFVNETTGIVELKNILIPVAKSPRPTRVTNSISQLVEGLGCQEVHVHYLHLGTQATMPSVPKRRSGCVENHLHLMSGDIVSTIVGQSRELCADLVAMATDGHHGFLDALRGNSTEQVLRQIDCPLWSVTSN